MKIFENEDERIDNVRIRAALDRVISRHKLSISEIDSFKNTTIALDRRNKKVVLIIHRNDVVSENCLSLDEVHSCRVKKEVDQLTGCTKKVILQLNFNAGEIVHFTFYDETRDKIHELLSRFRNATYWQSKLQRYLNNLEANYPFEYAL